MKIFTKINFEVLVLILYIIFNFKLLSLFLFSEASESWLIAVSMGNYNNSISFLSLFIGLFLNVFLLLFWINRRFEK